MAEYISREAVISNLIEQIEKYRNTAECETTELVIKRFAEYIASFPSADVQPVKRGEWGKRAYDRLQCSYCGKCEDVATDFCPNCGADMRGR